MVPGGTPDPPLGRACPIPSAPSDAGACVCANLFAVSLLRRLHPLDWLAGGLLALGALCVATGLLPTGPASDVLQRIGPLVVFLATVIVLAELTGKAEVFDVVATWVARAGRGRYPCCSVSACCSRPSPPSPSTWTRRRSC